MTSKKAKLIERVKERIATGEDLPSYFKLNEKNQYIGWVSNLAVHVPPTKQHLLKLDLHEAKDRFILFALAGAWSYTGHWESGAYFAVYLKDTSAAWTTDDWQNEGFVRSQIDEARKWCKKLARELGRKKARSFRNEFLDTTRLLAKNWKNIQDELDEASQSSDWEKFADDLGKLKILNYSTKSMSVKIPFILRELRCQGIYENIPGTLCCVADSRVCRVYREVFDDPLPVDKLKASARIYKDWGDWYDLPAFALTGPRDLEVDLSVK